MAAAIIFDMDGVLIDSEHVVMKSEQRALNEYGIEISTSELERFHGLASLEIFRTIKEERDAEFDPEEVERTKIQYYLDNIEDVEIIDDSPELVKELSRTYHTAVASNTERAIVEQIADHLGIRDTVEVLVSVDDVTEGKPSPEMFLHAAETMGVEPEQTVVIEDSPAGVEGGVNGGFITVGFSGVSDADLSQADTIVQDFPTFRTVLEQLEGSPDRRTKPGAPRP